MPRPKKGINSVTQDRIKIARKEMGCTQEEFAEKLFVSTSAVRQWEQGKTNIDDSNLINIEKLAVSLGFSNISYSWLKGVDAHTIIETSHNILEGFDPTTAEKIYISPLRDDRLAHHYQSLIINGYSPNDVTDCELFREYMESSIRNSIEFYIKNLNKEKENAP